MRLFAVSMFVILGVWALVALWGARELVKILEMTP